MDMVCIEEVLECRSLHATGKRPFTSMMVIHILMTDVSAIGSLLSAQNSVHVLSWVKMALMGAGGDQ